MPSGQSDNFNTIAYDADTPAESLLSPSTKKRINHPTIKNTDIARTENLDVPVACRIKANRMGPHIADSFENTEKYPKN